MEIADGPTNSLSDIESTHGSASLETATPPSLNSMQVQDADKFSCSSSTKSYSLGADENNLDLENGPFILQKRSKRRRGSNASGSDQTVVTRSEYGLTVIVKPKDGKDLISKINPLKLHEKLESIYPDGVISVRPNHRLNLLALDTRNTEATKALLALTCIGKIVVQTYEPRSLTSAVGVIRGVSTDISEAELQTALRGTTAVRHVRRLGSSEVVKIVFTTTTLPAHVTIGYTRFPILSYIEKPPKCSKCCRFGHVDGACNNEARCARCGNSHVTSACDAESPRCPNCKQSHESTSPRCPVYKREQAIYRHKSETGTGYLAAKTAVLSAKGPPSKVTSLPPSDISPHLSSTVEFPHLSNRATVDEPSISGRRLVHPLKRTTVGSNTDTSATKRREPSTKRRESSQTTHVEPSSSTLGASILQLISIIRSLLATLSSPFAQAVTSLIDMILPFFAPL